MIARRWMNLTTHTATVQAPTVSVIDELPIGLIGVVEGDGQR